MHAWQVELHVVPRRAFGTAPAGLMPAALATTDWWDHQAFPADYRMLLDGAGRVVDSPDPTSEAWGEVGGNEVHVTSAGGRVSRMTALADVRLLDARFGAALLMFARAADALLVRGDGLVIEPTIAAYAGALRSSAAWRESGEGARHAGALENGAGIGDEDGG